MLAEIFMKMSPRKGLEIPDEINFEIKKELVTTKETSDL
jgi:hypothetical protein